MIVQDWPLAPVAAVAAGGDAVGEAAVGRPLPVVAVAAG